VKILVSGDWQAQLSNLNRLELVVGQIIGECKKDPKTFFVHLGDIYHARNPVDVRVINFVRESLTAIRKACSGFYYVRGNHEPINMQDGSPSLCGMIADTGALAVADAEWVQIQGPLLTWNPHMRRSLWMYFVPYFRDMTRQRTEFEGPLNHIKLRTLEKHDDVRLLFFHNTITGSKQSLYTEGVGLTAADIGANKYDACFAGHVHLAQFVKPNIHVVGSPICQDFGELNYRHRIMAVTIPEERRR
jgi:DNA repair exonuclease SbcCD nuclease subunit